MRPEDLQALLRDETNRVEWKAGGDPEKIVKTLVGFANDYENVGSGRVLCGVRQGSGGEPEVVGITSGEARQIRDRVFDLSRGLANPPVSPVFDA